VDLYGQAQARNIAANCYAKVYMSGQSLETAKTIEAELGSFEFADTDGILRQRPLMTADEVIHLQDAIILQGSAPPIKTPLVPYYEQKSLRKLTQIPPFQLENKLSSSLPPVIDFDEE
jgi:type IV secretory pathway TraG/TraD family ATPase VirD4